MERTPIKQVSRPRPTPSPFPTSASSNSLLGKRGATEAGIDGMSPLPSLIAVDELMIETYTLQKAIRTLETRNETLTRRCASSQAAEERLEKEKRELQAEIAVLRQNRTSLVDKSTADGSLSESRAKVLEDDKVSISITVTSTIIINNNAPKS